MDPIAAALIAFLISACGFWIVQWIRGVTNRLNRHDILHDEHKDNHGLHEVKIATIVAELDNLTELSKETHDDVKKLVGYANGNSSRRTKE